MVDSVSRYILSYSRPLLAALLISAAGSIASAQERGSSPALPGHAPAGAEQAAPANEASFLAENDAAMNKMMADMAVKPTGDVDRDFVEMMEPHHQGAIDMAQALLRYGSNEQLKRLAQEIIVTQQQEIAAMRLAIGDPLPPSVPSPTQPAPDPLSASNGAMHMSHDQMKMK
jgi:uncharacterized protein (DUF305 family)